MLVTAVEIMYVNMFFLGPRKLPWLFYTAELVRITGKIMRNESQCLPVCHLSCSAACSMKTSEKKQTSIYQHILSLKVPLLQPTVWNTSCSKGRKVTLLKCKKHKRKEKLKNGLCWLLWVFRALWFWLLSSEDAGHRDWWNVRQNNLQNTAKEPEKSTTTIRFQPWKLMKIKWFLLPLY